MAKEITSTWEANDGKQFTGENARTLCLNYEKELEAKRSYEYLLGLGFRKIPMPKEFYIGWTGQDTPCYLYTAVAQCDEDLRIIRDYIKGDTISYNKVPMPTVAKFPYRYTVIVNNIRRKHAKFELFQSGEEMANLAGLASGFAGEVEVLPAVIEEGAEDICADCPYKWASLLAYNNETHTLKEWSEIIGIHPNTLMGRLNKLGWPLTKALTTPAGQNGRKANRS